MQHKWYCHQISTNISTTEAGQRKIHQVQENKWSILLLLHGQIMKLLHKRTPHMLNSEGKPHNIANTNLTLDEKVVCIISDTKSSSIEGTTKAPH